MQLPFGVVAGAGAQARVEVGDGGRFPAQTDPSLSRIELAKRRCDIDDLVAIAAALQVSPLALLQGPDAT
ncbi:hypothetical protein [Streptomyces longwoodensis]